MPGLHVDQRQFGRRRALIHAFILSARGNRVPCLVRNISTDGALLEVEDSRLIGQRFTLLVDSDQFEADCDVRHRTRQAVGVYFTDIRIARNGRDTRFAGPELVDTMRSIKIGDLSPDALIR